MSRTSLLCALLSACLDAAREPAASTASTPLRHTRNSSHPLAADRRAGACSSARCRRAPAACVARAARVPRRPEKGTQPLPAAPPAPAHPAGVCGGHGRAQTRGNPPRRRRTETEKRRGSAARARRWCLGLRGAHENQPSGRSRRRAVFLGTRMGHRRRRVGGDGLIAQGRTACGDCLLTQPPPPSPQFSITVLELANLLSAIGTLKFVAGISAVS